MLLQGLPKAAPTNVALIIKQRSAGERKQTKRNAQSKALAPNRDWGQPFVHTVVALIIKQRSASERKQIKRNVQSKALAPNRDRGQAAVSLFSQEYHYN